MTAYGGRESWVELSQKMNEDGVGWGKEAPWFSPFGIRVAPMGRPLGASEWATLMSAAREDTM